MKKNWIDTISPKLNKDYAQVKTYSHNRMLKIRINTAIGNTSIIFVNGMKFDVINSGEELIISDPNFQILNSRLYNQKIVLDPKLHYDQRNAINTANHLIDFLFLKKKDSKKAQILVDNIHSFSLKKLMNEYFNLRRNFDKELFIFGDDQARFMYGNQEDIDLKYLDGLKVRVSCDHSYIFKLNSGESTIDLLSGIRYSDSKYVYTDVPVRLKKEFSFQENGMTTTNAKNVESYFSHVVPTKKELQRSEKIPIEKAKGLVLKLHCENDRLYFTRNGKRITISHPDLAVEIVDPKYRRSRLVY